MRVEPGQSFKEALQQQLGDLVKLQGLPRETKLAQVIPPVKPKGNDKGQYEWVV